jgi:hypothetical protein
MVNKHGGQCGVYGWGGWFVGSEMEDLQKEVVLDCFFFFSKSYTLSGAMTASISIFQLFTHKILSTFKGS